jgi:hypothetical protein
VHGGEAVARAVDGGDTPAPALVGMRLYVGFIDLNDIGASGLEVADLLVDSRREGHDKGPEAAVVLIQGQLGHGEGAGDRDFDGPVGVSAQELNVAHLHRMGATNGADHARHVDRLAGAARHGSRPFEISAVEGSVKDCIDWIR